MKKKICFVASSGGHWEEMMRLKEIANENIAFYVTEKSGQITEAAIPDTYTLPQINRHEKGFFLHFLNVFVKAAGIIRKEKPCLLYTSPSPRDSTSSRMPSSA